MPRSDISSPIFTPILGFLVAAFASLSASSFPFMPIWLDRLEDASSYRQEIVKFSLCPTILTRMGDLLFRWSAHSVGLIIIARDGNLCLLTGDRCATWRASC